MGIRFAPIVVLAAVGLCLAACQKDEHAASAAQANGQRAAGPEGAQAAVQRQSVIILAQTVKDRMAQCAGDPPAPGPGKAKATVAALAVVERRKESSCTQLMTDLGAGKLFPPDWPDDQKAKFQRALNAYARYAALNMDRSQNAAMFMESVAGDPDSSGEVERYVTGTGAPSVEFRDRGDKLFREAAKSYGLSDRDIHLPGS